MIKKIIKNYDEFGYPCTYKTPLKIFLKPFLSSIEGGGEKQKQKSPSPLKDNFFKKIDKISFGLKVTEVNAIRQKCGKLFSYFS